MAALQTWAEIVATSLRSDKTIRESLQDAIYNVTPQETPILARLSQVPITNFFVEWLIDSYRDAADNAWLEDIAYTSQTLTPPTRAWNVSQHFYDGASVTDRNREVTHAGGDPFVYQESKRIVEMKRDMELAIVKGSIATGTTGTATRLGGIMNVASTCKTASSGTTLTEKVFNDLLELVWTNSAVVPYEIYCGPKLKRTVSLYNTKTATNENADAKTKTLTVDVYRSDFGNVRTFLHRNMQSHGTTSVNEFCCIDPNWLATGWLKPLKREVLSRDGTRDRFQLSADFTVLYRNEKTLLVGQSYMPYIA